MKKIAAYIAIALFILVGTPIANADRTQSSWLYDSSGFIFPAQNPVNVLIQGANDYLNFGTFSGSSGYGFRDNGGTIQFKNTGGNWTSIGSGGGGGSGGGSWSTSTCLTVLCNYPNNNTDIVTIGGNATSTATFWFDPNIQMASFSGKTGIGTTSPGFPLSIQSNNSTILNIATSSKNSVMSVSNNGSLTLGYNNMTNDSDTPTLLLRSPSFTGTGNVLQYQDRQAGAAGNVFSVNDKGQMQVQHASVYSNGLAVGNAIVTDGSSAGLLIFDRSGSGTFNEFYTSTTNGKSYFAFFDNLMGGNIVTMNNNDNVTGFGSSTPTIGKLSITGAGATTGLSFLQSDSNNVMHDVILDNGNVGISTTSPGSILSVGNTQGINFTTGTSTFNSTGGININSGCYAIAGSCLAGSVSSVSNSDQTLTISPTTGAVVASLRLANPNTWTGKQTINTAQFTNATSTNFASTNYYYGDGSRMSDMSAGYPKLYYPSGLGTLADGNSGNLFINAQLVDSTASVGSQGNILMNSYLNGMPAWTSTSSVKFFNLTTTGSSGAATYTGGTLNIPQYSGGGGTSNSKWATTTNNSAITPSGGTSIGVVIGRSATTTNSILEANGTTTATNFVATSTTATSTFTNVLVSGTLDAQNLILGPINWGYANMILATDGSGSTIATSTPTAANYVATSTKAASVFPYASTTAISATTICLTGDICRTTWPTGGSGASADWKQELNTYGTNSLTPTSTIPIEIKSTSTSTYAGGVESFTRIAAPYFNATSTTATSTFAGDVTIGSGSVGLVQDYTGNAGVGTSTPYATFSIQSGASTGDAFVVATTTKATIGGYDNDGHRFTGGPAPVISSCGTGTGTVIGDDQSGTITTATAATACTATFAKAYRATPTCTVTDNSLVGFADISTISTTAVTFGISSALTGGNLYYSCSYHK